MFPTCIPGSAFDFCWNKVPSIKNNVNESIIYINELFVSNRKLRKQLKEALEECITRLQEKMQLENE